MPSRQDAETDAIETAYADEFGLVAPDVYACANEIRARARGYAARVLSDNDAARADTLLLKAAAQVTRHLGGDPGGVTHLRGYLFRTFRRVLLAELEKDDNRRRFESRSAADAELRGQAENVERRILLGEIVKAMDPWTREVFEWLTLDYSFEEIARHLGAKPKAVRNRFYRRLERLRAALEGRRAAGGG
ncbi:MAG TPA: sigma-70 family RNA polymerase sigma factor [Pyrinomonadaceae bacterium]|nr:sigma-70 family RNA polymerase sigma factor [Pyrinomonadaceae bacterium]